MGRPSKPVALLQDGKRDHRSKQYLADRKKAEDKLKTGNSFNESAKVKNDLIAHKEFMRLKNLYSKIEYVEGLDEQLINRYCLLISELDACKLLHESMENDLDKCDEIKDRLTLYKAIASTQREYMKTQDLLLKMEDRLFLTPAGRIKSIPKKEKEKPRNSMEDEFGI